MKNNKTIWLRCGLFCITAVLLVITSEILKQMNIRIELAPIILVINVLIVTCAQFFADALLNSVFLSIAAVDTVVNVFAFINYFVMIFRGKPIYASDLSSIGTAFDVVGSYHWVVPKIMIAVTGVHVAWIAVVYFLSRKLLNTTKKQNLSKRIVKGVLSLLVLFVITNTALLDSVGVKAAFFSGDRNGLLLNFILSIDAGVYKKPEGYSVEGCEEILSQYKCEVQSIDKPLPNIVVIMNESFADLSIWGDVQTDTDYLKFYHSLSENVAKGYALSSVWGGNTANSEYEFLTGNTMRFPPNGSVPYQVYMNGETASLVSYLKGYGYQTIGVHPGHRDAWNRENVYNYFDFDKVCFLEDRDWETVRDYASDVACYDYIKECFANKSYAPLFVFNVTIQNHGGYLNSAYENTVSLKNTSYPQAEQYLSLIEESDRALEDLISYFESLDEEVVVLFFGDHQPRLDDDFVSMIMGSVPSELEQDDYDKLHYVPYFIWTNYDTAFDVDEFTSINFLSNYLLQVSGIPGSRYNLFLEKVHDEIPIISLTDVKYKSSDANDIDELLEQYRMLSYYYLFDNGSEKMWK